VRRGQQVGAATPLPAHGLHRAARWRIELSGQAPAYAATLFLATGKHDLRTLKRVPRTPPEDLVGFKSYFALAPAQHAALRNHVEVVMFEHGYAGLQHVEGGRANLCLLAQRAWLQQHGANWDGLLRALLCASPHLRARLDGAQALLERALAIYRVPYGYVHRADAAAPHGLYRLGDQVGVIPSFSGDGMSIALHSAARAVQAYLGGAGAPAYHRRIERDLGGQIGRAMLLYRLARRAPGQALLMSAARRWPAALRWAAACTRVAPGLLLTYPTHPTHPTPP
jgi:flavin-dependent dehydrogenase